MDQGLIQHMAEEFWEAAGGPEPFPRQLETPTLWALPLAVVKLPRLWIRHVEAWLASKGIPFRLNTAGDRPLHGCLLASGGRGWVLLNGTDSAQELRFSLAHEIAHFLLDYLEPRRWAVRRLGPRALEVLDGRRPPTLAERVHALLADVPLAAHVHLMDRQGPCGRVIQAECQADLLALELLAPAHEVWARVRRPLPLSFSSLAAQTTTMLRQTFGLPRSIALDYAQHLAHQWTGGPSVREWLGLT